MKIRSVAANNRRRAFEVRFGAKTLTFPFVKLEPPPATDDKVVRATVDAELGREGFGYVLASGREGTVLLDQVLEYNEDPDYLRDLLRYKLTLEAQVRVAASPLSKREIVRRLRTSATQFYRLLDQTNDRKSVDQMLRLLQVLDCEVDFVVRKASRRS